VAREKTLSVGFLKVHPNMGGAHFWAEKFGPPPTFGKAGGPPQIPGTVSPIPQLPRGLGTQPPKEPRGKKKKKNPIFCLVPPTGVQAGF